LKYSSKPEYEKVYKGILEEVGVGGRYLYVPSENSFTSVIGLDSLKVPFIAVCCGTGSTLQMDLVYKDFIIPRGSEVVVNRVLRSCHHDGSNHANADDYMYFPSSQGNIIRISRRDAPDHMLPIAKAVGLEVLMLAYHLPEKEAGPISDYVASGALMPIRIDCPSIQEARIIDVMKSTEKN
jgi:hypothetical protein